MAKIPNQFASTCLNLFATHLFASNCLGHFRRDSEPVPEYSPTAMSTLSIQLPDSIRQRVEVLAREDGVGVDAFVATVLSQRIAVAEADSYVRRRAAQGSARQMLDILEMAPKVVPEERDRLG